jgi:hypothetical protein
VPNLKFISLNVARINRLRRKPAREIVTYFIKRFRIGLLHAEDKVRIRFCETKINDKTLFEKIDFLTADLSFTGKELCDNNVGEAKANLITHMRLRMKPFFFYDKGNKDKLLVMIDQDFPESKEETLQSADAVLNHYFRLLGQDVKFGKEIDWHFAGSGRSWPLSFSPDIDYMSSRRLGDIKVPWELNRNQHFVVLGKAYWFTGDEKYAEEFVEQLRSWIDSNPYKLGINWMEGIETSIRLISWSFAYYFFIDSPIFEKTHIDFLKSVYQQTKFIERHLSDKWQINNNHLIAEASGLVIIGVLFPEFKEAPSWRKKGLKILEEELKSQILPDGFTWEYSIGYQKFITNFVILVCALLKRNNIDVPEPILKTLTNMIDFLQKVAKHDEMIPLIGDDDDGHAFKLTEEKYEDASSTIELGSYLIGENRLPGKKSEEALWLLSQKTLTNETDNEVWQDSRFFKNSGLFVFRDKEMFSLLTAGPQNARYLRAPHRHLDELSIVLEAYNTNFVIDSGTFTYSGDFKWRKKFKGRRAHNASIIDDMEPVKIDGAFELPITSTSRVFDTLIGKAFDWGSASYNGYKDMVHFRQLFFVKSNYWLIIDLFDGKGQHNYDLLFHFDSGINIDFDKEKNIVASGKNSSLKIVPLFATELKSEIEKEVISPRYGVLSEAFVLKFRQTGVSPKMFATLLFPFKHGSSEELVSKHITGTLVSHLCGLSKEKEKELAEIRVDIGGYSDYFTFPRSPSNLIQGSYFRRSN